MIRLRSGSRIFFPFFQASHRAHNSSTLPSAVEQLQTAHRPSVALSLSSLARSTGGALERHGRVMSFWNRAVFPRAPSTCRGEAEQNNTMPLTLRRSWCSVTEEGERTLFFTCPLLIPSLGPPENPLSSDGSKEGASPLGSPVDCFRNRPLPHWMRWPAKNVKTTIITSGI